MKIRGEEKTMLSAEILIFIRADNGTVITELVLEIAMKGVFGLSAIAV